MSVKEPWDEKWKTNCRTKIKGRNGVIALISKNTAKADGAKWEIKCAKDEKIPIVGMYAYSADRATAPAELGSTRVMTWTWDNIKNSSTDFERSRRKKKPSAHRGIKAHRKTWGQQCALAGRRRISSAGLRYRVRLP